MRRKGNLTRRILYKCLSLENYLYVLSKMYFVSFNMGFLKKNEIYKYPYFLDQILKKGDTCIDIGANLGYLSVLFSKLVGNEGRVYSVEPVKPVLSVLRRNTKKLKNIEIFPYALGEENKTMKLGNDSVSDKGFVASGSHFVLDKDSDADVVFEAEMKKGSELFSSLEKVDFIKCDIEGYEVVVLNEIKPIITKFKPLLLVESMGENRKQLIKFFEELGYRSLVLYNNLLYNAKEDEIWDILFVPNERQDILDKYAQDKSYSKT